MPKCLLNGPLILMYLDNITVAIFLKLLLVIERLGVLSNNLRQSKESGNSVSG